LAEEGVFYANVNIGSKKNGNWQGFPIVWRAFEFYNQACAANGLNVSDIGSLGDHGHDLDIKLQYSKRILKITIK
jgi:hypothetical protein